MFLLVYQQIHHYCIGIYPDFLRDANDDNKTGILLPWKCMNNTVFEKKNLIECLGWDTLLSLQQKLDI